MKKTICLVLTLVMLLTILPMNLIATTGDASTTLDIADFEVVLSEDLMLFSNGNWNEYDTEIGTDAFYEAIQTPGAYLVFTRDTAATDVLDYTNGGWEKFLILDSWWSGANMKGDGSTCQWIALGTANHTIAMATEYGQPYDIDIDCVFDDGIKVWYDCEDILAIWKAGAFNTTGGGDELHIISNSSPADQYKITNVSVVVPSGGDSNVLIPDVELPLIDNTSGYKIPLSSAGSKDNGAAYSIVEFSIPIWPQYGYAVDGDSIKLSLPSNYTSNGYTVYASYFVNFNGVSYALGLNADGVYEIAFGSLAHSYNAVDLNTVIPKSAVAGDYTTLNVIGVWSIAKDVYGNEVIRVGARDFKYYVDASQNAFTSSKFTTTFWPTTQRYEVKAVYNDVSASVSYCWDWNPTDGDDIAAAQTTWSAALTELKWDATIANKAMISVADSAKVTVELNKELVGDYYFLLNAKYNDGSAYNVNTNYITVGNETKTYAVCVRIKEPTKLITFDIPKELLYNSNSGLYNESITIECVDAFHITTLETINTEVSNGTLNGTLGDYTWSATSASATPVITYCGNVIDYSSNQWGSVIPTDVAIMLDSTDDDISSVDPDAESYTANNLTFTQKDNATTTVSWDSVHGATAYRILYGSYDVYSSVNSCDIPYAIDSDYVVYVFAIGANNVIKSVGKVSHVAGVISEPADYKNYKINLSSAGSKSNGAAYSTVEFTIPVWTQYGYAVDGDTINLSLPTEGTYVAVFDGITYTLGLNADGVYEIVFGSLSHSYNDIDKNTMLPQPSSPNENLIIKIIGTFPIQKDDFGNETYRVSAFDFKVFPNGGANGGTPKFTSVGEVGWENQTEYSYAVKAEYNDSSASVSYCWDWNPVDGADIAADDSSWNAGLTDLKWDATLTNKAMIMGAENAKVVLKLDRAIVGNYHFGLNATYSNGLGYDLSSNYINVAGETKTYAAYVEIKQPTDTITFNIPKSVLFSTNYGVFNESISIECIDTFHKTILDTIETQIRAGSLNGTLDNYAWSAPNTSSYFNVITFGGETVNNYWNQWENVRPISVDIVIDYTDSGTSDSNTSVPDSPESDDVEYTNYEITLSSAGSKDNGSAYSTVQFKIPVSAQYGYAVAGDSIKLSLPNTYTRNGYTVTASYVVVVNGTAYTLGLNDEGVYEIVFGSLAHGYNSIDRNTMIPQSVAIDDNDTITIIGTFSIAKDGIGKETLRISAADFKWYDSLSEMLYSYKLCADIDWTNFVPVMKYDVKAVYNDNVASVSYCWDWNPTDGKDIAAPDTTWNAGMTNLKWDATVVNRNMVTVADTAKVVLKLDKLLVGNYYFGLNAVYTNGLACDLSSNYLNVGSETRSFVTYVEITEPTDTIVFEIPKEVLYSKNYGVFNEYISIECIDVFHQTILDTIKSQTMPYGTIGKYSWRTDGGYKRIYFGGQEINQYWNQFVGTTNCAGNGVSPKSVSIVLGIANIDNPGGIVVDTPDSKTTHGANCTVISTANNSTITWIESPGSDIYKVIYYTNDGLNQTISVTGTTAIIPVGTSTGFTVLIIDSSDNTIAYASVAKVEADHEHIWDDGEVIIEANCSVPGLNKYTCTVCDTTKTESVDATGEHNYCDWFKENSDNHIRYCICAGCEKTETAEHKWDDGVVTTAPTCSTTGVKTFTCEDCDAIYTGIVEMTDDHIYGSWIKYYSGNHIRYCTNLGCGNTEILKHDWDTGDITIQPTCAAAGIKTYICTDCNATYTESVPATGMHSYGGWVKYDSTDHIRYCTGIACDAYEREAHIWYNDSDVSCNNCTHIRLLSPDSPLLIVSDDIVYQGQKATVNVSVKNCSLVDAIGLSLKYDSSILTFDPEGSIWINDCALLAEFDYNANRAAMTTESLFDPNYVFAQLSFIINENVPIGDVIIEVEALLKNEDTSVANISSSAKLTISDKLSGDINGNSSVDKNDAIYLLYSVLFGDTQYPLNQACDFNGDGSVDKNDAIYLLYHALFGETNYPLN